MALVELADWPHRHSVDLADGRTLGPPPDQANVDLAVAHNADLLANGYLVVIDPDLEPPVPIPDPVPVLVEGDSEPAAGQVPVAQGNGDPAVWADPETGEIYDVHSIWQPNAVSTGDAVNRAIAVGPAPWACELISAGYHPHQNNTILANDEANYWTCWLRNVRRFDLAWQIATKTTRNSDGETMVYRQDWNFDTRPLTGLKTDGSLARILAKGDVIDFAWFVTGTPANIPPGLYYAVTKRL